MRFLSYNDYCYEWTTDRVLCNNDQESHRVLIQDYKLTKEDHADVRAMGEWLWENHSKMTEKEFGFQMHENQFQGPHYTWKPQSSFYHEEQIINPFFNLGP